MLDVFYEGNVAKIDLRERIARGEHPKADLFDFVKTAKRGTVVEIHLPSPAPPLVAGLASVGVQAVVSELAPGHYRLRCAIPVTP